MTNMTNIEQAFHRFSVLIMEDNCTYHQIRDVLRAVLTSEEAARLGDEAVLYAYVKERWGAPWCSFTGELIADTQELLGYERAQQLLDPAGYPLEEEVRARLVELAATDQWPVYRAEMAAYEDGPQEQEKGSARDA